MGVARATSASERRTIRLLDYDPALGTTLRPERRAEAAATAEATLIRVEPGRRTLEELTGGHEAVYGVLLLDGLVSRTVVLDGVVSAQLLGHGDLVRTGSGRSEALVAVEVRWSVIEPLAVALLDERFLLTVRRWPELVAALFERLTAQEQRRDIHLALSQLPRVADRIHALLWLLAERWGRVTPQGVTLRLRLTHELIGQLVGAKRPTVTLALKELEERSSVDRRPDGGWLLRQPWTTPPRAEPDGVGLVPGEAPAAPPRSPSRLPTERQLDDLSRRIAQLERRRRNVADTLARSAAARAQSGALRARFADERAERR
jgi:CRP/FNR family transcriptional regulator, cyclic AMP receptor protein